MVKESTAIPRANATSFARRYMADTFLAERDSAQVQGLRFGYDFRNPRSPVAT
jgi:hypothetical protein